MLAPTFAVVMILAGPCVPAEPDSTPYRTAAVRSEAGWVNGLIKDGLRRSPTFARLASTIAERRGIVYVEPLRVLQADLVGAVPALVRRAPDGTRYTRVWLIRDKPPDQMIETLGHELQHVIELLDRDGDQGAPDVPRGTTRGRNWQTGVSIIETEAARHAGQAVHFELLTRRSPPGRQATGETDPLPKMRFADARCAEDQDVSAWPRNRVVASSRTRRE